jgi:hypothetical protein
MASRQSSTKPGLPAGQDELLEALKTLNLPIVRYQRRPARTSEESLGDVEFGVDSVNELALRIAKRTAAKIA